MSSFVRFYVLPLSVNKAEAKCIVQLPDWLTRVVTSGHYSVFPLCDVTGSETRWAGAPVIDSTVSRHNNTSRDSSITPHLTHTAHKCLMCKWQPLVTDSMLRGRYSKRRIYCRQINTSEYIIYNIIYYNITLTISTDVKNQVWLSFSYFIHFYILHLSFERRYKDDKM